jgi:hypothetical protein
MVNYISDGVKKDVVIGGCNDWLDMYCFTPLAVTFGVNH